MTMREKAIVSAYTGYLMCDMAEMLKYMSEKIGRPLSEQELMSRHDDHEFNIDLGQRVCPDFLALCDASDSSGKVPRWR